MSAPPAYAFSARSVPTRRRTGLVSILLALLITGISYFVYQRLGLLGLVFVSGALALGSIFAAISAKFLAIPVMIWFVSLMGFRTFFMLRTPGLPDISIDRALLLWILLVFLIRSTLAGKVRQRVEPLDGLLIVHALYLLVSLLMRKSFGMNAWTQSYLMGYSAYFVAKYVVAGRWTWIQWLFLLLTGLNLYHGVTGIAEHFHIDALIWPKTILDQDINRSFASRSSGVFMQPGVFGTMMGMQLPFHIYHMRVVRNPYVRALLYASFPVVLLGFYFCYTRGSWIAGLVALLTVGIVGRRQYLPLVGRLVLIGVVVLGTGLINLQKDEFFNERMGTERTITGRIGTLGRAYRVFIANPLFGCGFFRYNEVKAEYMGTMEVPIYGVIKRTHDVESTLHDMYIGALAEEGLV
ncbi:MAG: O-antigen ligase family protein, partial [bacterium]|nr:O-antigen ligase family protein [bacterium]